MVSLEKFQRRPTLWRIILWDRKPWKNAVQRVIDKLFWSVRDCTEGHVYPLLRLTELLFQKARELYGGTGTSEQVQHLSQRIMPAMTGVDVRGNLSQNL